MSRARFLADEDLRNSIVQAVRRMEPDVEITTVFEEGSSSATDVEVLEYAAEKILEYCSCVQYSLWA
jgi:hypothetical protein